MENINLYIDRLRVLWKKEVGTPTAYVHGGFVPPGTMGSSFLDDTFEMKGLNSGNNEESIYLFAVCFRYRPREDIHLRSFPGD